MSKANFLYPSWIELNRVGSEMKRRIADETIETMIKTEQNLLFVSACVRESHEHLTLNVRDTFDQTGRMLEFDFVYCALGHFCWSETLRDIILLTITAETAKWHNTQLLKEMRYVHPLHGKQSGSSSSSSSNNGDE